MFHQVTRWCKIIWSKNPKPTTKVTDEPPIILQLILKKIDTSNIDIFFSDKQKIQDKLKQSLRDRCENFMSNDWLPEDAEGHKPILIDKFYMEPDWTRTEEGGLEDTQVPMKSLYEIFDIYEKSNSRIIAEGEAFIFKIT